MNPTTISQEERIPSFISINSTSKNQETFALQKLKKISAERSSAPIRGFVSYTPEEQHAFATWVEKIENTYKEFGFSPIHLRPFEKLSNLLGETENQKQMFGVYRTDGNIDTGLALPFDHTVPLALYVAERLFHGDLPLPFKRYDISNSFRGENPQAGRFRAFVQADIDIVGEDLPLSADAECLATMVKALKELPIGSFTIHLNHIEIVKGIISSANIPEEFHAAVLRCIDKLDKLSKEEVIEEIEQIAGVPLHKEEIQALVERFLTPYPNFLEMTLSDRYGEKAIKALQDLQEICRFLSIMGIDLSLFQFTPRMVRGLDYYTGTVFETFLQEGAHFGSIASGGRYDKLIAKFSPDHEHIGGVGASIGLTRLFAITEKTSKRSSFAEVLVGYRTKEQLATAMKIATALRENHFLVDLFSGKPNAKGSYVKPLLHYGNASGIPFSVIAMEDTNFIVKDMTAPKENKKKEPDLTTIQEVVEKLNHLKFRA